MTSSSGPAAQTRRSQLRRAFIVLAVSIATFLPALPNGLLGDDTLLIDVRLDESRAPRLLELFRQSYWGDLHDSGLYRPFSLVFLGVQQRAFGQTPAYYRVVTLTLHALCSVLVLQLLGWLVSPRAAFGGALLFAAHPIHAEAVTTIYGQQDVLSALFFLGAIVAFLHFAGPRASKGGVALVAFMYLLSLLSKEQSLLLPLLLPLLRQQTRLRADPVFRLERRDLVMLVPLGVYALLRISALGTQVVPTADASVAYGYPWWARINLVIVTVGTYLRLLVLPWGQTTYYGHLRDSLFGWPVLEFAIVVGAVMLMNPLQQHLGRSVVLTAYAFLAVTLLPVANVLPIGVVVGERCLYLPAVAMCLIAAAAVQRAADARARVAAAALCAIVLTGMVLTARVAFRWRTPLMHWETTAIDHPRSAAAHARFALLLLHQAALDKARPDDPRLARAEQAIERASQINDRLPEAWHARGVLAMLQGNCAAAVPALERALALRSGDREIARLLQACR